MQQIFYVGKYLSLTSFQLYLILFEKHFILSQWNYEEFFSEVGVIKFKYKIILGKNNETKNQENYENDPREIGKRESEIETDRDKRERKEIKEREKRLKRGRERERVKEREREKRLKRRRER